MVVKPGLDVLRLLHVTWRCLIKARRGHLVARLLAVVDLLQGDGFRGEEVAQFGQIDAVPKPLLQLRGGRQLLVQTRLYPSAENTHTHTNITVNTTR